MEWRRYYPVKEMKIIGLIVAVSFILFPIGIFTFPFLAFIGFFGFSGGLGIGLAILMDHFWMKRDVRYQTTVFLSTRDLIEVIKSADNVVSRITWKKIKEDRIRIQFGWGNAIDYRPSTGVMILPEFSTEFHKREFPMRELCLQMSIDEICRKRKRKYSSPQQIDTEMISRLVEDLVNKEIRNQMGGDPKSYTINPVANIFNWSLMGLMIIGGIIGILLLLILTGDPIYTLLMGILFGSMGGLVVFMIIYGILCLKYGNFEMPPKFRFTINDLDLTSSKENKRTSIPYKNIDDVKRIGKTGALLITIDDDSRYSGGLYLITPKKIMISMSVDMMRDFQERLKERDHKHKRSGRRMRDRVRRTTR